MLKLVSVLKDWPFKEIILSAGCFYILYISRDRIRVNTMRWKAYYQSVQARLQDADKEATEVKYMMFKEVFAAFEKNWKMRYAGGDGESMDVPFNPAELSVLEIGINCGTNFRYFPSNMELTGIESNTICEKYAYKRLRESNIAHGNNITLKDYLMGYCENMSCIRSNSMHLVICTGHSFGIQDFEQALNEIHRVLQEDGVFVYLEDRSATEPIVLFAGPFAVDSSKNFTHSLPTSKFLRADKPLIQRVFKTKIYGIARK